MFGSSKANQLNKAHSELMERAISLSHDKGFLTAENKSLSREVESKSEEIETLKSQIKILQSNQEQLVTAASSLGLNFNVVLECAHDIHLSRALSLAGLFLKSQITQQGIPTFRDAVKTDYMREFLIESPGFVDAGEEVDANANANAEKYYNGVRLYALTLFQNKT